MAENECEHETICDGQFFERDVVCFHLFAFVYVVLNDFCKTKKSRSYFDIVNGSLLSMTSYLLVVSNIANRLGENKLFKKIFYFAIYG